MYLFQHAELEKLLGNLVYTVRQSRLAMTGEDRRGSKQELATALVLQHGIHLLASEEIAMRMPSIENPDEPSSEDLERIDRALEIRADKPKRRIAVLEHVVAIASDPANSVLYFGPSVGDAECMAYLLRERGIKAAVVSAGTRDVTRRNLIEQFRQNKLSVLCHCEVLTTP